MTDLVIENLPEGTYVLHQSEGKVYVRRTDEDSPDLERALEDIEIPPCAIHY